jgi:hypothetical protein
MHCWIGHGHCVQIIVGIGGIINGAIPASSDMSRALLTGRKNEMRVGVRALGFGGNS